MQYCFTARLFADKEMSGNQELLARTMSCWRAWLASTSFGLGELSNEENGAGYTKTELEDCHPGRYEVGIVRFRNRHAPVL